MELCHISSHGHKNNALFTLEQPQCNSCFNRSNLVMGWVPEIRVLEFTPLPKKYFFHIWWFIKVRYAKGVVVVELWKMFKYVKKIGEEWRKTIFNFSTHPNTHSKLDFFRVLAHFLLGTRNPSFMGSTQPIIKRDALFLLSSTIKTFVCPSGKCVQYVSKLSPQHLCHVDFQIIKRFVSFF